jgi:hypothetical protein
LAKEEGGAAMVRFLLDGWRLRRLLARAEQARRDKDSALTAFVTGAPIAVPFAPWSWRTDGQLDAGRLMDLIAACERLDAEVAASRARLDRRRPRAIWGRTVTVR